MDSGFVTAWFGLMFGITGIGGMTSVVVRMIRTARGGLR